jgi:hypothetical protein
MNAISIKTYNAAGYPLLWAVSKEPARLVEETVASGVRCAYWDVARGWSADLQSFAEADPLAAIAEAEKISEAVVFLMGYHRFIENPVVVQSLLNALPALKGHGATAIVVAPSATGIPAEWEPVARVWDHALPGEEMLDSILQRTLPEGQKIATEQAQAAIDAGKGMTAAGYEDAIALSLVQTGAVERETIWREKADAMRKSGGAEVHSGKERFSDIGGLDGLKRFSLRSLTSGRDGARGVMLLGCPGTGKSHFAKALGNEVGRSTVSVDMGRMFGSLVGESERMMRETLASVERMAPCVLFIDEIEKGLSGVQSSGKTDGGTSARVFGTFLTWLNDRPSGVYVVATCNDISSLPPEFLRQERWDGVFFVDLPTKTERDAIWKVYEAAYKATGKRPEAEGWTGAEIKSCCRLAHVQGITLEEAAEQTIPLTLTAGARVEEIRKGASGKTLSATTGKVYRIDESNAPAANSGRRVIKPSNPTNN